MLYTQHILNEGEYKKRKNRKVRYIYSNRLALGRLRKEDVLWSFAPHDISMI